MYRRIRKRQILLLLVPGAANLISLSVDASTFSVPPGVYQLRTETVMPNLEQNLRYTTIQTQQCLYKQEASSLFPVLREVSFVGCNLVNNSSISEHSEFDLICRNAEAATGSARFVLSPTSFRATLNIKMGGKNMKFSQRVYARRMGVCEATE